MLPTKFRFIRLSGFRGEDLKKNRPIRNKNCLWRPCLLMDRNEISNLYRGPSIDASYQVSVHMAEGFQRRRLKCEKLTDDGRQTMDAKWWQRLTLPLARWAKNGGPRSGLTCRASPWWKFEYFLPYFPNKFWSQQSADIGQWYSET